LRAIEDRMGTQINAVGAAHSKAEYIESLARELAELEAHVEKITVPLSYADELYALRNHIDLIRQKLVKA
jgi:endonuclease III